MSELVETPLTLEQKRLLLIRRTLGETAPPERAPIPRRTERGPAPASFAQQRLWFLDRLAPGNPFYTVSLVVELDGAISPGLLQDALTEIARRHEALRTTFQEHDGQPLQIIAPEPRFPLHIVDLSQWPPEAAAHELERLIAEETQRSFDLERGPLALARLVILEPHKSRLLLTLHHIVCDGWSLRLLGQELSALYTAAATGRPHDLPELAVQYADFSAWQRQALSGSALQAHLDYWTRQLDGAPELALPTDRRRPATPTYGGAFTPVRVSEATAARVKALCSEEGCTPFMALLAAYMVLLGRYAGLDDVLVAAPVAGRPRRELETLIGFFVNTLPLRGDLGGDPSFRELLRRLRRTCLEAFSHEDLPFDRLIQALAPERRGDRNPLAQVVFQLFSAPDRTVGAATHAERQRGTSKFDLRLDLWDTADGYAGELEFSTDLYETATAELMAEQYELLLHDLVCAVDRPISQASMLSPREGELAVAAWNATDRPWPADASIVSRFRETAAVYGDAAALVFDDGTLSYAELDRASDALARDLLDCGVRPGGRVVVLLPRSAAMICAWLGVLKAGAAYVPVESGAPPHRTQALIDAAAASAVITDAASAARLGPVGPERVFFADLASWLARDVEGPPVSPAPRDPAYVMFTSGSTGRPKGVIVPHCGVLRLVVGCDYVDLRPGEGIAQGSNSAFDAATFEVWGALLNGCRLVGVDRETLLSPEALAARIASGDFEHLFVTTALFNRLVAEAPGIFQPLRTVITGGSKCEPARMREVLAHGRPERLIHAYGPTEATTYALVWQVTDLPEHAVTAPIGGPIANSTAYVLDRLGRLTPRGAPGELFVGGPGVALGYLDEPEQTRRRFGPSPFREGERLYATGDRVRRRADGLIEFLGRFDDQVKVRGFRVEPDEIAAVLRQHPGVADAEVVVAKDPAAAGDDGDNLRIVAYYTPSLTAAGGTEEAVDAAAVAYWRKIYETVVYEEVGGSGGDAQFEIAGWTDTASGALLPAEQMAEQVAGTAARIAGLGGRRILEFGCGTGLLLFRLAPQVERFVGVDISERAIEHVRATAAEAGLQNVELRLGDIEALAGLEDGGFDVIVLNSVVQYFPSTAYLERVLKELVRVAAPGAAIFLGDIRHLGLLDAFHAEIELQRQDPGAPTLAAARAAERRREEEQELVLHPSYFHTLPQRIERTRAVEIQLKRGRAANELARHRFDVVLRLDEAPVAVAPQILEWGRDIHSLADIVERLQARPEAPFLVRNAPNPRVAGAVAATAAMADPSRFPTLEAVAQAAEAAPIGPDPEELWALAETLGVPVRLGWSQSPAAYDILFGAGAGGATQILPPGPDVRLANDPARGGALRRLGAALAAHLEQRLPDYMLPFDYVRVPALPLTANGKVDKALLARLDPPTVRRSGRRAPQTQAEQVVARIFKDVLQVREVGLDDDFFDLGGHSLRATQVISRIRTELGLALPLRTIFEVRTVAGLAAIISAGGGEPAEQQTPMTAAATAFDGDAIASMDDAALERMLVALDDEAQR